MGRQDDTGEHEGYVAHVFADGTYGSSWSGIQPVATCLPSGELMPYEQWQTRTAAEIVGWRPTCNSRRHRECWRGRLWTRVTEPGEHDPAQRRIYNAGAMLTDEHEDLILRQWEAHIAPMRGTADVRHAAAAVAEAEARLTAAVAAARQQGATWDAFARAAGMSRQSAHERWARVIGQDEQGGIVMTPSTSTDALMTVALVVLDSDIANLPTPSSWADLDAEQKHSYLTLARRLIDAGLITWPPVVPATPLDPTITEHLAAVIHTDIDQQWPAWTDLYDHARDSVRANVRALDDAGLLDRATAQKLTAALARPISRTFSRIAFTHWTTPDAGDPPF
ncbi:hypothetical protein [Nocardia farcinica]|uniref:hypothetical protein n=1 Tax=Nocardia farcinica TaxID=37329 RepID=UPI0024589678|nr:hypothetical protein [Nocardia farcinica]